MPSAPGGGQSSSATAISGGGSIGPRYDGGAMPPWVWGAGIAGVVLLAILGFVFMGGRK